MDPDAKRRIFELTDSKGISGLVLYRWSITSTFISLTKTKRNFQFY